MIRLISIIMIIVSATHLAFAEEFAEFKGRKLSHFEQEQMANDLMQWVLIKHEKAERRMVEAEYSAIKSYGRVDHDVINEYMRAGEPKEYLMPGYGAALKNRVKNLRNVMKKLPNYKGTVFRGASIKNVLLDKLKVGDILHEKAFLSTSTLPSVARDFAQGKVYEGVSAAQYKIDLNSSGRAINAYTFKHYEAEILAKPDTYFLVEDIKKYSAEKNYIKLKELKKPSSYIRENSESHIYDSFSGEEVTLKSRIHLSCL
ncbi:hypothetical protein BS333_05690 [Vibrio azureus]|nr:ADP-ribosyltransferase [Vibrio azureus]AUI87377.1 hypothetical protein BS333_05690 [Vibrio azureus]